MRRQTGLLAGLLVILGSALFVSFEYSKDDSQKGEPGMSSNQRNINAILDIFSAIERRDVSRELELFQPDVELHWPPPLPYGGITHGLKPERNSWGQTWIPLQPTDAERKMDPRVVAASDDEVVVLWHQRGLTTAGDRLDVEVLGLYQFRDAKLARAQMFYFDTAAVLNFVSKAGSRPIRSKT